MNRLKTSGWKYWDHFQAINPGASVKGRNTFSALHTVPDLKDLGSDNEGVSTTTGVITTTSVTTPTSLPPSPMNVDHIPTDSGNKRHLSITSLSRESRVKSVPTSSTVVSSEGCEDLPSSCIHWTEASDGGSSGHYLCLTQGLCSKIMSWNDFIHSQRQLPSSSAENALHQVVY